MRIAAIFAGILLLILWGLAQIPSFNVHWEFINVDFPNPLNLVAGITLVTLYGFSLTIGLVVLAFTILLLAMGIWPSRSPQSQ